MAKNQNTEPRYTVINVTERVRPGANGKFDRVVEVSYESARGHRGIVNVPLDHASPDAVRLAINADIGRIEAIYNLFD